jgi:hypothetical protein
VYFKITKIESSLHVRNFNLSTTQKILRFCDISDYKYISKTFEIFVSSLNIESQVVTIFTTCVTTLTLVTSHRECVYMVLLFSAIFFFKLH